MMNEKIKVILKSDKSKLLTFSYLQKMGFAWK